MVILFVVVFIFSTIHIAFADQLNLFSFKSPSNQGELKIKEKIDGDLFKFKSAVNEDILKDFSINLINFKEISHEEIIGNQEYKSLQSVFFSILKGQKEGDILPTVYLSGEEGYILEKKANGKNFIYHIQNQNGWEIVKTDKSLGKIIRFEDVNSPQKTK